ncbi:MAG: fibronectin type III domain-containing protein, partial [bacterium]|nr:fibronectin type III domain-containing protein [bacterium]
MDTRIQLLLPFVFAALSAAALPAQPGGALPEPLPLFPPDNWWNVDVSTAPVDSQSDDFIDFIGPGDGMHPDFGGDADTPPDIYGMPYVVVAGSQPLERVSFVEYGDESDDGAPGRPLGYPIPPEAKTQPYWIEGGHPGNAEVDGDRHMLIVDRDNRILFELYHTFWNAGRNRWEAGSGAIFPLDGNDRRPEDWTSADAAGLAILPGLVRYDELFGPGPIGHAFRFTVHATNGHVYPASHTAGSTSGAPPMGTRLRLKAGVDLSGYPPEVRKIFQAMKTYGLILADNGSDMFVQGTYDTRWDNDVLNPAFRSIEARDFEVIELGWRPEEPADVPAAPTGLEAEATSSRRVSLEWRDRSDDETAFHVEMRDGGGFREVAMVARDVTRAVISGLDPATTYTFRVRASNSAGFSSYSNRATVTTPDTAAGCTPGDTRLCLSRSRFRVEVEWTAPAGGGGAGRAVE